MNESWLYTNFYEVERRLSFPSQKIFLSHVVSLWDQINLKLTKQTLEIIALTGCQKVYFPYLNVSYDFLYLQRTQQALEHSDRVSTDRSRTCTCCPSWLWTVGLQLLAQLAHLPSMCVAVMHTESSNPATPQPSAWEQPSAQELSSPCLSACSLLSVKKHILTHFTSSSKRVDSYGRFVLLRF